MKHYDYTVIGSGPAGKRAAIQAAKLNKNVAIIEKKGVVGGVTVHTGTIPSKTLREAVLYLSGWRQRGFYGRSYKLKQRISAEDLMQRLEITLRHEVEIIQHQLTRNNVDIIHAKASFIDEHTLKLIDHANEESIITAEKILIAVGTCPHHPANITFDGVSIIDSDDVLKMTKLPKSLAVVGAGVIGVEYATIFSAMDIEVTY